jgi:regulator of sigma E protease
MTSLFYFLVSLALLVVIHEFGHFWVARKCGVKVLTFSVGFGKTIWSRTAKSGTEYRVAAIPLGGYVKMLDEREVEVDETELDQTFNRKSVLARIAIVTAGPIANLIFAIFAYWLIFVIGIPGIKPIIGSVEPTSVAAEASLVAGDEITAVNGHTTSTLASVNNLISELTATDNQVTMTIRSGNVYREHIFDISGLNLTTLPLLSQIGIKPVEIEIMPVVGQVVEGSPAEKAGLKKGDLLFSYDDRQITTWSEWVGLIKKSPDIPLAITLNRGGDLIDLVITPEKTQEGTGRIGAGVDTSKTTIPERLKSIQKENVFEAVYPAISKTISFSMSTVKGIVGMVVGTVSVDNLGGPISIAQIAGDSAQHGVVAFLSFLAMVSISLGVLNLLPIPVLDGGHLMFLIIEGLRGKPLSARVQLKAQNIGIILLLALMMTAFFNDLSRLFG